MRAVTNSVRVNGAQRAGRVAGDVLLALALLAAEAAVGAIVLFLLIMDGWGEPAEDRPFLIALGVGAALTGTCAVFLLRARLPAAGLTQGLLAVAFAGVALFGIASADGTGGSGGSGTGGTGGPGSACRSGGDSHECLGG